MIVKNILREQSQADAHGKVEGDGYFISERIPPYCFVLDDIKGVL